MLRARFRTHVLKDTVRGCPKIRQYQLCYSSNTRRSDSGTTPIKNSRTGRNKSPTCNRTKRQEKGKYGVARLVCHFTTKTGPHYIVRRYGYSSKDETSKTPEHLPKYLMDAYWRLEKLQSVCTKRRGNNGTGSKNIGQQSRITDVAT